MPGAPPTPWTQWKAPATQSLWVAGAFTRPLPGRRRGARPAGAASARHTRLAGVTRRGFNTR